MRETPGCTAFVRFCRELVRRGLDRVLFAAAIFAVATEAAADHAANRLPATHRSDAAAARLWPIGGRSSQDHSRRQTSAES